MINLSVGLLIVLYIQSSKFFLYLDFCENNDINGFINQLVTPTSLTTAKSHLAIGKEYECKM